MPVDSTHPSYDAMVPHWDMMADACSSERDVHTLGEKYVSRLKGQTDDKYRAYISRGSFTMFTKRTVEAFHGMVMRKDVQIEGFNTINIDGKGSSVNSYVGNVVENFIKYGRCGTLVDMPVVSEKISVADEIEKNIFPRLLYYSHADIINWKTKVINNIEVLSMVVLREPHDKALDEFEHDIVYYYRVLDLVDGKYRQRMYDDTMNQVGGDVYPKKSNKELNFIPFYFHGGIKVRYPPLLSIAEQNFHHYRVDVDYKHGLHAVALPTPWVTGVSESQKPKTIGPNTLWAFEEPEVRCGMLEFTGAGLSQFAKAKEEIVEIIITLASRIIAPQKSSNDESALAASIRSNAETSSLASIIESLSEDITNAIRTIVWWTNGSADKVKVTINKDFMPSNMSGTDVLSYITAWIKGGISYPSLFQLLKEGEVIKGDRTIMDELADIDDEKKKRLADEIQKQKLQLQAESAADDTGLREPRDPEAATKLDLRTT